MARPDEYEKTDTGYLTVRLLGSGYAAVHMVKVTIFSRATDKEVYSYEDVQQTGIGRYRTSEEALKEARQWSESDKIPLVGG